MNNRSEYARKYFQKNKEKIYKRQAKLLEIPEKKERRRLLQRNRRRFLYRNDPIYREKANETAKKTYQKRKHKIKIYNKKRSKTIEYAARIFCRNAVRAGILKRPKICPRCKKKRKIQGHHENYKKPLDVVWLCQLCHLEEHHID